MDEFRIRFCSKFSPMRGLGPKWCYERQTPNVERRTPNTERKRCNARGSTPNTQRPTPNTQPKRIDSRNVRPIRAANLRALRSRARARGGKLRLGFFRETLS